MISILLPTRGRPEGFKRFIDSVKQTISNKEEIEVLVGIDNDDTSTRQYDFTGCRVFEGPRCSPTKWCNALAEHAGGDVFVPMSDDIICETQGWDLALRQVIGDSKVACVWADDMNGRDNPTILIFTLGWKEIQGCLINDSCEHDFGDTWAADVARNAGVLVDGRVQLKFRHLHPDFGTAPIDQTYKDGMSTRQQDQKIFEDGERVRIEECGRMVDATVNLMPEKVGKDPLPISVIVPLQEDRKGLFEGIVRPMIHKNSPSELIVVAGEGGPGNKRNKGAEQAKHDYLFFCDDDIILHEGCLAKLHDYALRMQADVVYCDLVLVNNPLLKDMVFEAGAFSFERLIKRNFISNMALIRRDRFMKYDTALPILEDWEMWLRMEKAGSKFAYLPLVLFTALYRGECRTDPELSDSIEPQIRKLYER